MAASDGNGGGEVVDDGDLFSEMSNSAKTELVNTTLKSIYLRRCRNQSKKISGTAGANMTQEFEDLGDFVAFWLTAFQNLFLIPMNSHDDSQPSIFESGDDICYIVEKLSDESGALVPSLQVKRFGDIRHRDSLHSVFSSCTDWEETTCLNLLIHLCRFKLCCGILEKIGAGSGADRRRASSSHRPRMQLKKQFVVTTYASPFKHRMDKKSSRNTLSFPNLYFLIDDFESAWGDVFLLPNQDFCVELVAEIDPKLMHMYSDQATATAETTPDTHTAATPPSSLSSSSSILNQTAVFLGASSYSAIQQVFEKRHASSNFITSFSTLFNKRQEVPTEFINMTGPNKIGKAQVAVTPLVYMDQWSGAVLDSVPSTTEGSSSSGTGTSLDSLCKIEKGLHCGITYVSVPFDHIMKSIFDSPKEPSLLTAASNNEQQNSA